MARRDYLGNFELMVLLALIRLGEGAYGVPVAREIESKTGRTISLGGIYATLDRLEQRALVTSVLGDPTLERGGRAKRYFQVTAKGFREVRAAQRAFKRLWEGIPGLEGERA